MNKSILFLLLFSLSFTALIAQNLGQDCCAAQQLLDGNLVTISSNSGMGEINENTSACSCIASNERDAYWFSFFALTSGTFEMMIFPDDLSADFDYALFAADCPCSPSTLTLSCDYTGPITPPGPFVPTGISSTPSATFGVDGNTEFRPTIEIEEGMVYYILANNITQNGVGFTIQFDGTANIGPPPIVNPAPLNNVDGTINTCVGASETYTILSNPDFDFYEWTATDTTANILLQGDTLVVVEWNSIGTFDLCVTGLAGCLTTEESCTTVNILPPPAATLFTENICAGDSLFIDNVAYFEEGVYEILLNCDSLIELQLSLTENIITDFFAEACLGQQVLFNDELYDETGIYTDTLTGSNGCDSIVAFNLTIFEEITITFSTITPADIGENNGEITVFPSMTPSSLQFLWSNGSTTATATDLAAGFYQLTITNANGCVTEFEFEIPLAVSTTNIADNAQFTLSPNPIHRDEMLQFSCSERAISLSKVKIVDINGQSIFEKKFQPAIQKGRLQMPDVAGIYLLIFETETERFVEKVVVY